MAIQLEGNYLEATFRFQHREVYENKMPPKRAASCALFNKL